MLVRDLAQPEGGLVEACPGVRGGRAEERELQLGAGSRQPVAAGVAAARPEFRRAAAPAASGARTSAARTVGNTSRNCS
ncbi:hypothetical protein [Streptomyces sp. NPDC088115]|uniref:hypothetical protein n=1 Tax=Streptomyces sp. NPDC088115 TaxID=3365824 RepID=UPI0038171409